MLGSADRIVVLKEQTTIVSDGKNSEAVAARIKTIRSDADATESEVLLLYTSVLSSYTLLYSVYICKVYM